MADQELLNRQGLVNSASSTGEIPAWMNVEVLLIAEIGQAYIKVNELMQVGRGAVIELGRRVDGPIALKVGNKLVAEGDVKVDKEKLSIVITEKNQ